MRCDAGRSADFFVATARAGRTAQWGGDPDGCCGPAVVRRRGVGDPEERPRAPAPGQHRFLAVVCALAGLGRSSPLPRTARQRQGAHSARDPAAHDGQGGGLPHQPPLCSAQGRFPEVAAQRGRRVAVRRLGAGRRGRGARFEDLLGVDVPEVVSRLAGCGSGAFQSRPKPRGRSTSRASRSRSHTSARRSAVRESASASGSWSRQCW